MIRLFGAALLLAGLAGEAHAATRLIAVLPLDIRMTEGKMNPAAQASLEEMLRDIATDALAAGGWTVLTGENMLAKLRDNGVDVTRCSDESCHVDMAREIKVQKFISGAVEYVDGEFTASIRLVDTETGSIIAAEHVEGKTVTALRKDFASKANVFFAKAGLISAAAPEQSDSAPPPPPPADDTGPHVSKGKVTQSFGQLTVTSKPRTSVRLELIDPDGKHRSSGVPYDNAHASPGRWKVSASAPGYATEVQEVDVPADDVAVVRFELKRQGGLKITGTPNGADVTVTGPNAFKDDGGLPWDATGLASGTYHVRVDRRGYVPFEQDVNVEPGAPTIVRVALAKGVEAALRPAPKSPIVLVPHPGGTFLRGCEPKDTRCEKEENPSIRTTIKPFWMFKTEVTQAAYRQCVVAGACTEPDSHHFPNRCNWGESDRESHPENCVDWDQARTYCKWVGGRLPTPDEWEYAAKGGESRIYPWGNDLPTFETAVFHTQTTMPVGSCPKGATKFGVLDMAGNVSEWTASDPPADKPQVRGGGRDNDEPDLRTSHIETNGSGRRSAVIGFRCVLDRS